MRLLTLCLSLLAAPAAAHEFWIAPEAYQIEADGQLVGALVNGQDFAGTNLPYLPQRFVHFVAVSGSNVTQVPGRVGDTPALNMPAAGDGLHVLAYQSRNAVVNYTEWEKFQSFVDHKDLGDVESRHLARGLNTEMFNEVYSRYSKSLIGAGSGAGSDVRTGLETELVALTNPYTDDVSGGMRLQLYYQQDVRADAQVEILEKAPDGTVTQAFYRTDEAGIATVPVKAGHEYMADAVVLREPEPGLADARDAVWETLWANMTWKMPD